MPPFTIPRRIRRPAAAPPPPARPCPNCGQFVEKAFCPSCGQRNTDYLISLRRILQEFLDDQLSLNSAMPRTLGALFFRPGHLTAEYVAGRIMRYNAPFRLYLVFSLLFFLVISFQQGGSLFDTGSSDTAAAAGSPTPADRTAEALAATTDAAAADDPDAAGSDAQDTPAAGDTPEEAGPPRTGPARRGADVQRMGDMIGDMEIATPYPVLNRYVEAFVDRVSPMTPEQVVRAFLDNFKRHVPKALFVLLPLYAFLLKILYIRQRRFYVEHFIFSLHIHAFTFAAFTALVVLPNRLDTLVLLWMPLYVFLAMRRVYGQHWFLTGVKYMILGTIYSVAVSLALTAAAVAALITL